MQESFLYVIAASPEGPTKLGFSIHPERRLSQLQTGHAEPLVLFHAEPVPSEKARLYERLLHRDIGYTKLRGEWFNLTVEQAIAHVRFTFIEYDLVDNLAEKVRRRQI